MGGLSKRRVSLGREGRGQSEDCEESDGRVGDHVSAGTSARCSGPAETTTGDGPTERAKGDPASSQHGQQYGQDCVSSA
jgi:hypothetical protein